jgi:ankyrin repeat protein
MQQMGSEHVAMEIPALLIKAAARNDVELCRQLVAEGADVNGEHEVMTALHAAAKEGALQAVQWLIGAGANVKQCLRGRNSRDGEEPLDLAMWANHLEVCKCLIEAGADPVRERSFMGSPFHLAIANGNVQLVELILERGVSSAVQVPSAPDNLTPFQFAVQNRKLELIALIGRRGEEDLAQRSADGRTLLQLARSDKQTVALLRALRTEREVSKATLKGQVSDAAHNTSADSSLARSATCPIL